MADKQAQLTALLVKSAKFIVANLGTIEKEVYIFAITHKDNQLIRASKTLALIADVLSAYEANDSSYTPRQYPESFKAKVGEAKRLKLVQQVDALITLVRGKVVQVIQRIKGGAFDAKLSSDVIKMNNILKAYIASLTTKKESQAS